MDSWTKHTNNPIFSPDLGSWDRVIEDFVVVKRGKRYYAFYSGGGGYESLSGIGVAVADSPLGPFSRFAKDPFIKGGHMRIGSVIKFGRTWRMYFSREKGDVFMAESQDMLEWCQMPKPLARNAVQPCVQKFGKRYIMLATDMIEKGIVAMWSDDGIEFTNRKKIMVMKQNTGYEFGLSNPSFIVHRRKIHIMFEGRPTEFSTYRGESIGNWRIFEAMWNGHDDVVMPTEPSLDTSEGQWDEAQVANPNIAKFGKNHYLYYSGWGERKRFDVGVARRSA